MHEQAAQRSPRFARSVSVDRDQKRSGPAIAFHNPMKFGALLLVQVSPLRHDIVPEHETDGRSDLAGANGKTSRADFSNHSVLGRYGTNAYLREFLVEPTVHLARKNDRSGQCLSSLVNQVGRSINQ